MLRGLVIAAVFTLGVAAQAAGAEPYRAPRNSWGRPDIGGLWTSASLTGLERPPGLSGLILSEAEAAAFERRRADVWTAEADSDGVSPPNADWWEAPRRLARIAGRPRSSWIVDPADGRLPYSAAGLATRARARAETSADNPETLRPPGRCLSPAWGAAGPPMLNAPYSNLYQIMETKDEVAIFMEANHETRFVRLGARHLPAQIRPWMGDSVGRWDGETLVVETTNFNPGDALRPPSPLYISQEAKVTERFTRVAADRLLYEFVVEDPAVFTQTWRAQMIFEPAKGPILQYACHEGNYSLPNILSGARQEEAAAVRAAQAVKAPR